MSQCNPGATIAARSLARAAGVAQTFAEGNMTATVSITRPAPPVFDESTGDLAESTSVVYAGKARVATVAGPVQIVSGDSPTFYSSTSVSVPLAVIDVRVDDIVTVTGAPDPGIVGRVFRVTDVEGGGQLPVVRRLAVVGIQHARSGDYT